MTHGISGDSWKISGGCHVTFAAPTAPVHAAQHRPLLTSTVHVSPLHRLFISPLSTNCSYRHAPAPRQTILCTAPAIAENPRSETTHQLPSARLCERPAAPAGWARAAAACTPLKACRLSSTCEPHTPTRWQHQPAAQRAGVNSSA